MTDVERLLDVHTTMVPGALEGTVRSYTFLGGAVEEAVHRDSDDVDHVRWEMPRMLENWTEEYDRWKGMDDSGVRPPSGQMVL
jgi:hypothetical protein